MGGRQKGQKGQKLEKLPQTGHRMRAVVLANKWQKRQKLPDHHDWGARDRGDLQRQFLTAKKGVEAHCMGRPDKGRATDNPTPTIILVRPQLGENIGMAARAMLNCGLSTLRLVTPRDGWPNEKATRAASGADIVLDQAEVFESVDEAVADLEHVVATTARNRELSQRIVTPRHAAGEIHAWIGRGEKVGILFGPERTGLTNDDMVQADTALSIPLNPQFSSLNIAQAVLLVAYEWAAAKDDSQPVERMSDYATRPATKDELQNLFGHLERALDQSGFLRNAAMRPSMVQNLRAFLQRSGMTEQEVRTFHGVIKYLAKHKHSEE